MIHSMMKNQAKPTNLIGFHRANLMEACRYTSLHPTIIGDLWCNAMVSDADLETFRLNGWPFRLLTNPVDNTETVAKS